MFFSYFHNSEYFHALELFFLYGFYMSYVRGAELKRRDALVHHLEEVNGVTSLHP